MRTPLLAIAFLLTGCVVATADPVRVATPTVRPAGTPAAAPVGTLWWENGFDADVHPSARSAALAVGRRWGSEIASKAEGSPAALHITFSTRVEETIRQSLFSGLADSLPNVELEFITDKVEMAKRHQARLLTATLKCSDHNAKEGFVELLNTTPGGPALRISARFQSKQWADDFSAYLEKQSTKEWLVVDSGNPMPTAEQASNAAAWAATDQLMPLVSSRLASRHSGWSTQQEQALRNMLYAELRTRHYTKDVFIQSFTRPYGVVWREAILISTSPGQLGKISAELGRRFDQRRKAVWSTAGSVIGVLVTTFALYLLANSVTKGYFRGWLRFAAVTFAIAVILLILSVGMYGMRHAG